jgi:hypothetical protein
MVESALKVKLHQFCWKARDYLYKKENSSLEKYEKRVEKENKSVYSLL